MVVVGRRIYRKGDNNGPLVSTIYHMPGEYSFPVMGRYPGFTTNWRGVEMIFLLVVVAACIFLEAARLREAKSHGRGIL